MEMSSYNSQVPCFPKKPLFLTSALQPAISGDSYTKSPVKLNTTAGDAGI